MESYIPTSAQIQALIDETRAPVLNTANYGYLASLQRLAAMTNPKREVNHHETEKDCK